MKQAPAIETRPLKRLKQMLSSGNIWLYLLSTIKKQKEAYAYNLNDKIEKIFKFKPGRVMVYIVLYRLENEKLIKSSFRDRRKYYRITEKGEETLKSAKQLLLLLSKRI